MKVRAVALVVLVLAAVVSGYFLIRADELPKNVTTSNQALSGSAETAFTYNASLKPNVLYNSTMVGPSRGDLFPALVNSINFSYTFSLSLDPSASTTVLLDEDLVASTIAWNLTLTPPEGSSYQFSGVPSLTAHQSLDMNMTHTLEEFSEVLNETNFPTSTIDLLYQSEILYSVNASGTSSTHVLTTTFPLTYTLDSITPGNRTFFSNWTDNVTGTAPNSAASFYLGAAAALTAVIVFGIALLVYLELRPPVPRPVGPEDEEAELQAVIGPYRDAVAETLSLPRKENIVVVREWMDIVRAADMLGKPILHLKSEIENKPRHIFYVVDGAIQYVYLHSVLPPEAPTQNSTGSGFLGRLRGPRPP